MAKNKTKKQYQVLADSVVMTGAPDYEAEATSELLYGEHVTVIGVDNDEWVKCRSEIDGYEGFVPRAAMDDEITPPDHKITAIRSFAFSEPDFKSPPVRSLSFMSRLSVMLDDEGYALLSQGGWVPLQHIAPLDALQPDIAQSATAFLGAPYLWGGRTSLGLDCSALVQLSLLNAGIDCPRDSKDQMQTVGKDIAIDAPKKRGDLVFFEGHVGIMIDDTRLINATSRHMSVCIEDLSAVISDYDDGILSVKRI